jgi:hypothetical protein
MPARSLQLAKHTSYTSIYIYIYIYMRTIWHPAGTVGKGNKGEEDKPDVMDLGAGVWRAGGVCACLCLSSVCGLCGVVLLLLCVCVCGCQIYF